MLVWHRWVHYAMPTLVWNVNARALSSLHLFLQIYPTRVPGWNMGVIWKVPSCAYSKTFPESASPPLVWCNMSAKTDLCLRLIRELWFLAIYHCTCKSWGVHHIDRGPPLRCGEEGSALYQRTDSIHNYFINGGILVASQKLREFIGSMPKRGARTDSRYSPVYRKLLTPSARHIGFTRAYRLDTG